MEGSERVERRRKRSKSGKRYSADEKLKIVKLQAEEGYSVALLSQEFGVSDHSRYNHRRLHQSNNYLTPAEYETMFYKQSA